MPALRESLNHTPVELQFGTSGRRGRVVDLTQLEVFINSLAEVQYLGKPGENCYFALDLRPSSPRVAQAVVAAIREAGLNPVNLGYLPTPALMAYAVARGKCSIMVTGSHIPFDRNGYKVNSRAGELRKSDEGPVNDRVKKIRARLYAQPAAESPFGPDGSLKSTPDLPPVLTGKDEDATEAWIRRYTDFFAGSSLSGKRLLVYQHSAVGRDILVEILRRLGADVVPAGRSSEFVPIDTEAIGAAELATIQQLVDRHTASGKPFDAVVSLDGDSDRPLILGVNSTGKATFYGGDLLGMVVAEYLQADAVVVPISCNDGVDRGPLAPYLEPKTRIGSPFVIAGIEAALAKGRTRVCGWEPNGGFLTGSPIERNGRVLSPLPTRDAFLPLLAALFASVQYACTIDELFARLPKRFSRAALLRNFPRSTSLRILEYLNPSTAAQVFTQALGFGPVTRIDTTDGVRISFDNADVAHVRPSGNADELRIYAVSGTQSRADQIAAYAVAEPDGILRTLERAVNSSL